MRPLTLVANTSKKFMAIFYIIIWILYYKHICSERHELLPPLTVKLNSRRFKGGSILNENHQFQIQVVNSLDLFSDTDVSFKKEASGPVGVVPGLQFWGRVAVGVESCFCNVVIFTIFLKIWGLGKIWV